MYLTCFERLVTLSVVLGSSPPCCLLNDRRTHHSQLQERRPELLSSVLLRQSPHSVQEWLKRAALFEGTPAKVIHTYATAVKTVDPSKAIGKPHLIWLAFAKFYEEHADLKNARVILRKASLVPYKVVDDLAAVWMGWAEMELRHKHYDKARAVLAEATMIPPAAKRAKHIEEAGPVQGRLYKTTKLWAFYADLQECLGISKVSDLTRPDLIRPALPCHAMPCLPCHACHGQGLRCHAMAKACACAQWPMSCNYSR